MLAAVVAANQRADVAFGTVHVIRVRREVQAHLIPGGTAPDPARLLIVENDADVCDRPRIGWQQSDFSQAVQQDQLLVAAWANAHQRRPGPGVDQSAARPAVQDDAAAIRRVDQAGLPDAVFPQQDRRHAGAVPADQFRGAVVLEINTPGHPIVGICRDDPNLRSGAPLRCHLAGQPMTVRRMDHPSNRPVDR